MSNDPITIRSFTSTDAEAVKSLRLRALREHPEAYSASYADRRNQPAEAFVARHLAHESVHSLGAFAGNVLVGTVTFYYNESAKVRHRGHLVAMYVAPETRGRGVGRQLVDALIAHARTQPVEELVLAVIIGNTAARRLYEATGFQPLYVEPRHLKIDAEYFDAQWMSLQL